MEEEFWKEEYNVGCDYIDQAHRKLFSVLHKTQRLCSDKDYTKNKYACVESIKFLKNYTNTHFLQEEGFMKQQGYKAMGIHKMLHDEMRETTIPELEKKLTDSDYSRETVMEFLGVFAGWLSAHIMVEDFAITGKAISRYSVIEKSKEIEILERDARKFLCDVIGVKVKVVDAEFRVAKPAAAHVTGESTATTAPSTSAALGSVAPASPLADSFLYEMEYDTVKLVFVAQNPLIYAIVSRILGQNVDKMDKTVLLTFVQMVHNFVKPALMLFSPEEVEKNSVKRSITGEILGEYFETYSTKCSVKWETDCGIFALCVFEKE